MATALQMYPEILRMSSSNVTMFAPSDAALSSVTPLQGFIDLLGYHFVNRNMLFNDLVELPVGTRLGTLIPGLSLEVISTIEGNSPMLLINEAQVIAPDIYHDDFISVHGVNGVLDPNLLGFHIPFMQVPPELQVPPEFLPSVLPLPESPRAATFGLNTPPQDPHMGVDLRPAALSSDTFAVPVDRLQPPPAGRIGPPPTLGMTTPLAADPPSGMPSSESNNTHDQHNPLA
ncbi:hypothetical protein O6H91_04G072100 [Diphasiastrum complanatum]|nr:hypothetical protein O6H91_04G072100 [Diphasiastrum complanatum]